MVSGSITYPTSVTGELGSNVQLVCSDSAGIVKDFQWKDVTSGQEVVISPPTGKYNNFRIVHATDSNVTTLAIDGLELEDEGTYICDAIGQPDDFHSADVVVEGTVQVIRKASTNWAI